MKKEILFFSTMTILILALTLQLNGCGAEKNAEEIPVPTALYDYERLYSLSSSLAPLEAMQELASLLQSKELLEVGTISFSADEAYLEIDFLLNLTEENSKYKVNHQKIMQDQIVLFALFPQIEEIRISYVQDEYGFIVPASRAVASDIFGENITYYGETKEQFISDLPSKLEAVIYTPDAMDTVDFFHAINFDGE